MGSKNTGRGRGAPKNRRGIVRLRSRAERREESCGGIPGNCGSLWNGESVDVVSGLRERLPLASEQSLIPLRFREHDKVSGGLPFWLQDLVSRSSRVSS